MILDRQLLIDDFGINNSWQIAYVANNLYGWWFIWLAYMIDDP